MYGARNFRQILTKFVFPLEVFIEVHNVKFHGNPASGSRVDTSEHIDRETDTNLKELFAITLTRLIRKPFKLKKLNFVYTVICLK